MIWSGCLSSSASTPNGCKRRSYRAGTKSRWTRYFQNLYLTDFPVIHTDGLRSIKRRPPLPARTGATFRDRDMKRCLFVDDSAVIRKVAKRILGGPDLQIIEASTGFDAIAMCVGDMPDIIVVDGALPDMSRGGVHPPRPRSRQPDQATNRDLPHRSRHRRDHARQARRRSRVLAEAVQPAAVARPFPQPAKRSLIARVSDRKCESG